MKYTLYVWTADDEGGYGICEFGKFSPMTGYDPESGWRAKPSEKVGDFSSIDELASLILKDMSKETDDFYISDAYNEAKWLMEHCYYFGFNF